MKNDIQNLNYENITKHLITYLDLHRQPVGVKFLYSKDDFDEFDAPTKDIAMPYCTMVRNATQNKSFKAKKTNFACHTGAKALGVMKITEDDESAQRHVNMGVYRNINVSEKVHNDMVYCNHEAYGVGIKPLGEYTTDPDVVVIITSGYGIMRVIQGKAYHLGQTKNIKMTGMNAMCQECTSYPFVTNDINISVFCSGCRHVCQWEKEDLGIGIPINILGIIVDGIISTSNPMDRNVDKKRIEKFRTKECINNEQNVIYNKNYYTGAYKSYSNNIKEFSKD